MVSGELRDVLTTGELMGATIVSQNPPDSPSPVFNGRSTSHSIATCLVWQVPEMVFGARHCAAPGQRLRTNIIREKSSLYGIWVSGNEGVTVQRNSTVVRQRWNRVVAGYRGFSWTARARRCVQSNVVTEVWARWHPGLELKLPSARSSSGQRTACSRGRIASNSNISIRSNYVADSGPHGDLGQRTERRHDSG